MTGEKLKVIVGGTMLLIWLYVLALFVFAL